MNRLPKQAGLATILGTLLLPSCGIMPNLRDLRDHMSLPQLQQAAADAEKKRIGVWKYRDFNSDGTIQPHEIAYVLDTQRAQGEQVSQLERTWYDNASRSVELGKGDEIVVLYHTKGTNLPEGQPIEFTIRGPQGNRIFSTTIPSHGWDGGGVTPQGKLGGVKGGNFIYTGKPLSGEHDGKSINNKVKDHMRQNPGHYIFTATSGHSNSSARIQFR